MPDLHHEIVFFTGRVQGVGFRFTTVQIAKEFEVVGSVKNLADGRVEVDVEGAAKEVNAFIAALQERMHGYIRKTEQASVPPTRAFRGFLIK